MDDAGQDDQIAHNQSRDDGRRHDQIYCLNRNLLLYYVTNPPLLFLP